MLANTLPGYYGLKPGSWAHWARVWDLDPKWIKGQFDAGSYEQSKGKGVPVMNSKGIPVSRWIDGVFDEPHAVLMAGAGRTQWATPIESLVEPVGANLK